MSFVSATAESQIGRGSLRGAVIMPNGTNLLTFGGRGISIWSLPDGALLGTLTVLGKDVRCAAVSSDGTQIATGHDAGVIGLWSVATGTLLRALNGHTGSITAVAFSHDDQFLLSGSEDETARLWAISNRTTVATFAGHSNIVLDVAFDQSDTRVVTASADGASRVWSIAGTNILQAFGKADWARSVTVSDNDQLVLSTSDSGLGFIWSVTNATSFVELDPGHTAEARCGDLSSDGLLALTGGFDGTARLWSTADGSFLGMVQAHPSGVHTVAVLPGDDQFITAGFDGWVKIWNTTNLALVNSFMAGTDGFSSVSVSPDGTTVAAGTYDGKAVLWSANDGTVQSIFTGHTSIVSTVDFSPNGTNLLTGSWGGGGTNGNVKLWDLTTGTVERDYVVRNGLAVLDVNFAPDGQSFAAVAGQGVVISSATSATALHSWSHPGGTTNAGITYGTAFSPDSTMVASVGGDERVRIWSPATGLSVRNWAAHADTITDVAFSADGSRVATASRDGLAQVWAVTNGALVETFAGHRGEVTSVTFSPDDRFVLTGGEDGTARLWNATNGTLITTYTGHTATVTGVDFFPDGERFATSSLDGSVLIWAMDPTLLPLRLRIDAVGSHVAVRWPAALTNISLERASVPNATSWSPVTNSSVVVGDDSVVEIESEGEARFFRAVRPK